MYIPTYAICAYHQTGWFSYMARCTRYNSM